MAGNILTVVIVIWAVYYSAVKLHSFVKEAGRKDVKCSCSSCPYMSKR
jgi:hypothetical protein